MNRYWNGKSFIGFPFFVLMIMLSSFQTSVAQYNEFGIGAGAFNYRGDLVRTFDVMNFRPGFMAHYRRNLSGYVSARVALSGGSLYGSDAKPYDVLGLERNESFRTSLFEISGTFEYYFLDFRVDKALVNWSPYIFGGFSMFLFNPQQEKRAEYSSIQPAIPMGIGIRYNFSRKLGIAFEFGARKTFFDWLDNVSEGNTGVKDYKYGNHFTNDWFYFTALSVSYTIYTIPCPFKVN